MRRLGFIPAEAEFCSSLSLTGCFTDQLLARVFKQTVTCSHRLLQKDVACMFPWSSGY